MQFIARQLDKWDFGGVGDVAQEKPPVVNRGLLGILGV